jgi:hypothetical protein
MVCCLCEERYCEEADEMWKEPLGKERAVSRSGERDSKT